MTACQIIALLRRHESRNVTFVEPDGSWPIVWERAQGVHVWDASGKKYLDLTAAFGVAAAGHANPNVVRAGQQQMAKLLHAMGDVHPHALKAQLARELSRLTFERWAQKNRKSKIENQKWGKVVFSNSGFEAVESALKTAVLATGRRGIIAFEGGYHGLGYGALNATHREHFRGPFRSQLREFGHFVPFPVAADVRRLKSTPKQPEPPHVGCHEVERHLRQIFRREKIGAIIVEPVQARGGIHVPPPAFLPLLRQLCDQHGALLILDEIYTGFGRTGKWFACEHAGVVPDLICLGKALTGGFPLSACVGRADLMDAAWPASNGEAIHTSTFLGHPVGCAMALAQIKEIRRLKLCERSARMGEFLRAELNRIPIPEVEARTRGVGLMAGIELTLPDGRPATRLALDVVKRMLHHGCVVLPEGEQANVISFTPPLTITKPQIAKTMKILTSILAHKFTAPLLALMLTGLVLLSSGCATGRPDSGAVPTLGTVQLLEKFAAEKQAQADRATNAAAPGFAPFFAAAKRGDWLAVSNVFAEFRSHAGQYEHSGATDERLRGPRWEAVKEVWGAFDAFNEGNGKYSSLFGREVIASIPPGSIYFGGTDPGRFIITAMCRSQVEGDPFFTLTQNALADMTYLEYLHFIYGGRIDLPTTEDQQTCFQEYVQEAQRRSAENRLKPGENVTINNGRVQISGQTAVMEINGLLAKIICDRNSGREVFIEESFPLDWMCPRLEPHGFIFKLNRQPLALLPDDVVRRDREFWQAQVNGMIGGWLQEATPVAEVMAFAEKVYLRGDLEGFGGDLAFVRNAYTSRMFAKLRTSIAGLYAWRAEQAVDTSEKERMARAADFAFRQALALCPSSPETISRYPDFLKSQNREDEAALVKGIAEKFPKTKRD